MSDMNNETLILKAVELADECYDEGRESFVDEVASAVLNSDIEKVAELIQEMLKVRSEHHHAK